MKLEKRSERMQNLIDGAWETVIVICFFVSMYALYLLLWASYEVPQ